MERGEQQVVGAAGGARRSKRLKSVSTVEKAMQVAPRPDSHHGCDTGLLPED
jgi:hypothetical protein